MGISGAARSSTEGSALSPSHTWVIALLVGRFGRFFATQSTSWYIEVYAVLECMCLGDDFVAVIMQVFSSVILVHFGF